MTNVAYYVDVTEYEFGWGCRPDGYIVCLNREHLQKKCQDVNSHKGEEFSRTGDIKLCIVTEQMYDKLVKNENGYGWIWTNNSKEWLKEE